MNRPALAARITRDLTRFPAVVVTGSRQVGKTTLARAIAGSWTSGATCLDLELPSDTAKLADPETFLRGHADRLVVLDEVQHAPGLFAVLRGLIDADRRPGRFLLLGSASPALLGQSAESLAGRVSYLEVPPFGLVEVADDVASQQAAVAMSEQAAVASGSGAASASVPGRLRAATTEARWVRGGYPPSWLAATEDDSLAWRRAYISAAIERDLPRLDVRVPVPQLRRFWTMLAHWQGQTWNAAKIAASLGVTGPTTSRWLDVLDEARLVRVLRPHHANLKKRLVKAPKVYVRDTGILHALLGLPDRDAVLGHPVAGPSFEGFVIDQILSSLPEHVDAGFFGTHAGNEIDLVLRPPGGVAVAVEVKLSSAPRLTRGLPVAMDDMGCERGFVVTPSTDRWPLSPRVEAIGIGEFLRDVVTGM